MVEGKTQDILSIASDLQGASEQPLNYLSDSWSNSQSNSQLSISFDACTANNVRRQPSIKFCELSEYHSER